MKSAVHKDCRSAKYRVRVERNRKKYHRPAEKRNDRIGYDRRED